MEKPKKLSYYNEFINPKLEAEDFYLVDGKMVMSEKYHTKRGSCCGNGCKHCPYWPPHQKSNKEFKHT